MIRLTDASGLSALNSLIEREQAHQVGSAIAHMEVATERTRFGENHGFKPLSGYRLLHKSLSL